VRGRTGLWKDIRMQDEQSVSPLVIVSLAEITFHAERHLSLPIVLNFFHRPRWLRPNFLYRPQHTPEITVIGFL